MPVIWKDVREVFFTMFSDLKKVTWGYLKKDFYPFGANCMKGSKSSENNMLHTLFRDEIGQ